MSGNKPKVALDTSRVEFFIEMKSVADPFDDHPSKSHPFVRESGNSRTSLGQITIYATAIDTGHLVSHTRILGYHGGK
jgi:hypothetical protein